MGDEFQASLRYSDCPVLYPGPSACGVTEIQGPPWRRGHEAGSWFSLCSLGLLQSGPVASPSHSQGEKIVLTKFLSNNAWIQEKIMKMAPR